MQMKLSKLFNFIDKVYSYLIKALSVFMIFIFTITSITTSFVELVMAEDNNITSLSQCSGTAYIDLKHASADTLVKDKNGVSLSSWCQTYNTPEGLSGIAYCAALGKKCTTGGNYEVKFKADRYSNEKTAGCLASGYPNKTLSFAQDYYGIPTLTEREYLVATQLAIWASLGQLQIEGTDSTGSVGVVYSNNTDQSAQKAIECAAKIYENAKKWKYPNAVGMGIAPSERNKYTDYLTSDMRGLDFSSAAPNGEGTIKSAYEKKENKSGIYKQTLIDPFTSEEREYYIMYFDAWSETDINRDFINVGINNPDKVPEGTFVTTLSAEEYDGEKILTPDKYDKNPKPQVIFKPVYIYDKNYPNGYRCLNRFKLCIPVDSAEETKDTVKIDMRAMSNFCSQYNIYLGERPDTESQPFVIADPGYIPLNAESSVTWGSSKNVRDDTGEIELIKYDKTGTQFLAGAEFKLTSTDDGGKTSLTGTTDSNGKITFKDLPVYIDNDTLKNKIQYKIEETKAPDGYSIVDNVPPVTLTAGETATVTVKNDDEKKVQLFKIDANSHASLQDAIFTFKQIDGTFESDFRTDAGGLIELREKELPFGAYEITEKTPPEGYEKTNEIRTINWNGKKDISIEFTNVRTPSFRLIKIDGETKEGIPDISFNLYKNGQFIKSVGPTKFDGSVMVTDLETGFYQIQEISAPSGYLKDDFKYEIYIDANNPINEIPALTIANYKKPSFRIRKIDAVTGNPIAGTVFKVSFQGQEGFNVTTGEDGTVTLDNLDLGTYSVREEWVPEGYILDKETVKTVEITKNTTEVITLVFENLPQKDILINKIDAETKKPLKDVEFEIFRNNKSLGTKITNDEGKILIEKAEAGEYKIVEIKTLDNYILNNKPLEFTHMPKNQSTDVYEYTIENYEKRDIMIIKADKDTGWRLSGAEFTVVSQDGKYNEKFTTDENGEILIKNLDNNTYIITETKAPNGYELPTDINEIRRTIVLNEESEPIVKFQFSDSPKSGLLIRKLDSVTKQPIPNVTFTVEKMKDNSYEAPKTYITNENGVIVIEDIEQAWYRITETATVDGYVLNPEPQMVHVTNTHEAVEVIAYNNQKNMLNILKIDSVTGKPLIGAMFDIFTAGGTHIANVKTGVNGYATLPNLEPGSYVVKEIEAPDGHIIDPTPQTFEIEKGDSGKTITLIFRNDNKINLYIKKIDNQTNLPLANAEFKITKANGEIIAENIKTGEDGLFLINNLLPGTYIVSETKAPNGYILDSTPKTVYLEANQTKVVEFSNSKPGGVTIRKIDAVTGNGLEGAEFEIYTVDDRYIGKYVTDKDGYIHIENLQPGFYFIKETKAPDGYVINNEKQKVEVKEFEPTNIIIENSQKSSLTIQKIDSETKLPLAGAKFQITDMEGKIINTVESNSSGIAEVTGLTNGYYIIKEIISPEGYILNQTPQTIQIKENVPAQLIFPNTQLKGILIKKIDSVTKEPLAGAKFEIHSMDDKLIGEYTTDNSGVITSEQLKPGFYKIKEIKAPDGYLIDNKEQVIEITEGSVTTLTFTRR